jgi:fucose permease
MMPVVWVRRVLCFNIFVYDILYIKFMNQSLSPMLMQPWQKRGYIALVMLFWFVISFITNIMGPLIPDIISNFHLTHLALAAFIPTSFFVAYAVMSIPAGILIEKWSEKAVFICGFSFPLIGSLIFVMMPCFTVLLISSFIIGLGMAMLQTVINPFTRVAGGEAHFAFYSVMGQLVFGGASFVSPLVYSYLVGALTNYDGNGSWLITLLAASTPAGLPWVSLYWLFAFILVLIIGMVIVVRFPRIELKDDERAGTLHQYKQLFVSKTTYLFFFGIMAYVATEQGIANWISAFLQQYHHLDPQSEGAATVGYFWGAMSVGCLLGLLLLKLFDSKLVLRGAIILAVLFLVCAVFGSATISVGCFPLVGFCLSVMFSVVMSLGLNSVDSLHGAFAGILCSGIVGGAIGPLVVGWLADQVGLQTAMLFPVLTLGYLFFLSIAAKPLINNEIMSFSRLFGFLKNKKEPLH